MTDKYLLRIEYAIPANSLAFQEGHSWPQGLPVFSIQVEWLWHPQLNEKDYEKDN
jgi:hypothetical protein